MAWPTANHTEGRYALYAHCHRCNTTHGPMGSWPQQCFTSGCGDSAQMVRVDGPEAKR